MEKSKNAKEEVKKALECCIKGDCCDCPYYDGCTQGLTTDTLNLITEQEKEIERLKAENKSKERENAFLKYCQCLTQKAKIDVLNEVKKYLHTEDFNTPDERWRPESEFYAIIDKIIEDINK